ncbi:hypothetical protein O3G_MSEX009253 [Manduca sexta]|uniref:Uncharacterized protein n=1 Tax=Manduca sexta TaxID=7130 RepID=A0A921ZDR7_MANSE|nr:hypothetical protein O3G_MSEX009253 [Manduca sexta]
MLKTLNYFWDENLLRNHLMTRDIFDSCFEKKNYINTFTTQNHTRIFFFVFDIDSLLFPAVCPRRKGCINNVVTRHRDGRDARANHIKITPLQRSFRPIVVCAPRPCV